MGLLPALKLEERGPALLARATLTDVVGRRPAGLEGSMELIASVVEVSITEVLCSCFGMFRSGILKIDR